MMDDVQQRIRALRDCRIEAARLEAELNAARGTTQAETIEESLRQCQRRARQIQAFVDLDYLDPDVRPMVAQYYAMAALDLTNRADGVGPDNVAHTDALFAMWDELRQHGVEVLPLGELAVSPQEGAALREGAELFRQLAVATMRAASGP